MVSIILSASLVAKEIGFEVMQKFLTWNAIMVLTIPIILLCTLAIMIKVYPDYFEKVLASIALAPDLFNNSEFNTLILMGFTIAATLISLNVARELDHKKSD